MGFVGNSGSPEFVHLHLEVRRVRDGVDVWRLPGDALHGREYSIVSDPRNALPLRAAPEHLGKCAVRPSRQMPRYWLGGPIRLTSPWADVLVWNR